MTSDPTNEDRANWAESALDTFGIETYGGRTFAPTVKEQPNEGDDAYTMIQDLISNLLHLAKRHGWDPAEINRRAVAIFDDEVAEAEEIAAEGADT